MFNIVNKTISQVSALMPIISNNFIHLFLIYPETCSVQQKDVYLTKFPRSCKSVWIVLEHKYECTSHKSLAFPCCIHWIFQNKYSYLYILRENECGSMFLCEIASVFPHGLLLLLCFITDSKINKYTDHIIIKNIS